MLLDDQYDVIRPDIINTLKILLRQEALDGSCFCHSFEPSQPSILQKLSNDGIIKLDWIIDNIPECDEKLKGTMGYVNMRYRWAYGGKWHGDMSSTIGVFGEHASFYMGKYLVDVSGANLSKLIAEHEGKANTTSEGSKLVVSRQFAIEYDCQCRVKNILYDKELISMRPQEKIVAAIIMKNFASERRNTTITEIISTLKKSGYPKTTFTYEGIRSYISKIRATFKNTTSQDEKYFPSAGTNQYTFAP